MARPQEIVITDDFYVWVADGGTALPAFGGDDRVDPAGFESVANGLRINEDGITITFSRTMQEIHTSRSRQPIKVVNTMESVMVKFDSCAFTLESLAQNLLGSAAEAVVDTAAGVGTAGFRTLELDRGLDVKQYALIAQFGYSPYADGLKGDLYLPFCYQSADPEEVFSKNDAGQDGVRVQAVERRQFHDEAELPVHGRGFDLGARCRLGRLHQRSTRSYCW